MSIFGVLVCVVLGQILPALRYFAFSDTWMEIQGFTAEQLKARTGPISYMARIVSTSLMAYTIGWIFTKIPVKSFSSGILKGLLFGFVLVFCDTVVKNMFSLD